MKQTYTKARALALPHWNAECGMRNAESGGSYSTLRTPHSAVGAAWRYGLAGLLLALLAVTAAAQSPQTGGEIKPAAIGPSADTIQPYRAPGRDPFRRVVKPKTKVEAERQRIQQLGFPEFRVRQAEFQRKVDAALQRDLPEPDPFTQYLVEELEVSGVFRDGQGMGAFVRASPTGRMFFIRAGTRCYNGEVLRIDGSDPEAGGAKVILKQMTYMEINGKRTEQQSVVTKAPGSPSTSK